MEYPTSVETFHYLEDFLSVSYLGMTKHLTRSWERTGFTQFYLMENA